MKGLNKKKMSGEYYEILSKHLNLVQVYIYGTGYLLPNGGGNIEHLVQTITQSVDKDKLVKEHVMELIHDIVKTSLQYMDSHRDRQVVKALFAEITSVNFAAKLQGIQSRQGTSAAKRSLLTNLEHFSQIKQTSQVLRSDMTISQQHLLTQRIINRRKVNEIKTIAKGRRRKLKAHQFPELGIALEHAFGEIDFQHDGG